MAKQQQTERQKRRELETLTERYHRERQALSELDRAMRTVDFDIADCQTRIASLQNRLASLMQMKVELPHRLESQRSKTSSAKRAFTLAFVQPQLEKLKRLRAVIENEGKEPH